MARKIVYRGMEVEELKKLSLDDFIKLIPSSSRRTMKRMGPRVKKFLEKFRGRKDPKKPMKTHYRDMVILPEMLGARFQVYNGKEWVDFEVKTEMLGHRLGEYSHTCKLVRHSGPGVGATRGSKSVELK